MKRPPAKFRFLTSTHSFAERMPIVLFILLLQSFEKNVRPTVNISWFHVCVCRIRLAMHFCVEKLRSSSLCLLFVFSSSLPQVISL